ncbi:hypothetical protein ACS6L2_13325 [Aquirufa ecclesiirivi]
MRQYIALTLILFVYTNSINAQSPKVDYNNQELLNIPVEAAYYLYKRDDFALTNFLTNKNGLENNKFSRSKNNYFEYSRNLMGIRNESNFYLTTLNAFTIFVDKRNEYEVIEANYLKSNINKENLTDKSFFEYLEKHPKLVKHDGTFWLIIRGEDKNTVKVVIGIIPDYYSSLLKYNVLFFKYDESVKIQEILQQLAL